MIHAVWSIRVLNIRASTQIWQKNKSNLRVFPVLKLISQEYPQYSISDTKGNVISHVTIHFLGHQAWTFRYVLELKMVIAVPRNNENLKFWIFFLPPTPFLLIIYLKTSANKLGWPSSKGTLKGGVPGTGTCKSSEYWNNFALRVV